MKVILILTTLLLGVNGFSQIEFTDSFGDIIEDDIVEASGDEEMLYLFGIKNVTGDALNLKIERLKLIAIEGALDYFAFGTLEDSYAYPDGFVSPENPYVSPNSSSFSDEEIGSLNVFYKPEGTSGCGHYRYYILNEEDTRIDSMDVMFCSTVGIEEEQNLIVSVYPNPSATIVNIELVENANNVNFSLFNVLGENVMDSKLSAGNNTVNIASLPNGVYFYSILRDGQVSETKKLIIRH